MALAELPCEKKTCLGFNWTILRPTPASSRKAARSKVMLLTSKVMLTVPYKLYTLCLAYSVQFLTYTRKLCTVSDITRTLSGIVGLAHTLIVIWFCLKVRIPCARAALRTLF